MDDKEIRSGKRNEDNLTAGARGGAIAFTLKISSTALGFLNQIILARVLGAGGIGEVILAITVVRISVQIAKFGMEEAMMKFIPIFIDQEDKERLKGTIVFVIKYCLSFSAVFMFLILLVSRFISVEIFHSEGLIKLMPVVILAIPAWVVRDVTGGILRAYKDTLRALIPESMISPLFRIVIFLILILLGPSPMYAVIAFVAGEILAVISSLLFLHARIKGLRRIRGKCEKRKVLDVAYTIIFTSMTILLFTDADKIVLGFFTSTETVGIYGIAAKLVILVYFPMYALGAIIPPLISSIYSSGDIGELRKMASVSTRWILSMAMPIILILVFEGKYILRYAYGSEFEAGYTVLLILTLGQLIKAGTGLVGNILQMTGEHKIYMKINLLWGVVNIILNILLVPRYGMVGAAAATAVCLSMIDFMCIYIIHKRLSVLTLAKGLKFDIIFIVIVSVCYILLNYGGLAPGQHILLGVALSVYIWKSIYNHDIPLHLLVSR